MSSELKAEGGKAEGTLTPVLCPEGEGEFLAARLQDHDGQRRQRDFDGMRAAVGHVVGGHDAGAVAQVAAAVVRASRC